MPIFLMRFLLGGEKSRFAPSNPDSSGLTSQEGPSWVRKRPAFGSIAARPSKLDAFCRSVILDEGRAASTFFFRAERWPSGLRQNVTTHFRSGEVAER